jgi:hypothetical protein
MKRVNIFDSNMDEKQIAKLGLSILLPISMSVLAGIIFLCMSYSSQRRLSDFKSYLRDLSDYEVKIEHQDTDFDIAVINELKKVRSLSDHHSHPERTIQIEIIRKNDVLKIKLGRDSQNQNEYWVFIDGSSNEIGRILTDYFDEY